MEAKGAQYIFNTSVEKYHLGYSQYLGDGDTESFKKVADAKPYGDAVVPTKLECVGHVQKRLGAHLRKLKADLNGRKLSDGKPISGKGRLTDKIINKMQNYYGMGIRQNSIQQWDNDHGTALYMMKKAVLAMLFNCSEIEKRHQFCPRTQDSWCKFWTEKKRNIFN